MQRKLFFMIGFLLIVLACMPTQPQLTQDVETIVQATFQSLTLTAQSVVNESTATPLPISDSPTASIPTFTPVASGSIAGNLSYPSEFIPAQTIVAFDVNSNAYYYVQTAENQNTYQIDNIPAGTYFVVAYTQDGALSAGYSYAVPCGLSVDCTDNNLIPINVIAGQVTNDANPQDWYAPPGSFPAYPLP